MSTSLQFSSQTPMKATGPDGTWMVAVFEALRFDRMVVSNGALREGLLSGIVGSLHQRDRRDATVRAMKRRFSVDLEQAGRVASTAAFLFEVVRRDWHLRRSQEGLMLRWGALLHEIGMSVNQKMPVASVVARMIG